MHSLVMHCGSTRDHAQRANLGQIGDQGVSHAIDKILLAWVSGEIFQRQNSNGLDLAREIGGPSQNQFANAWNPCCDESSDRQQDHHNRGREKQLPSFNL